MSAKGPGAVSVYSPSPTRVQPPSPFEQHAGRLTGELLLGASGPLAKCREWDRVGVRGMTALQVVQLEARTKGMLRVGSVGAPHRF